MYVRNHDKLPDPQDLRLSAKAKDDSGYWTWEKKIEVVTKYMALGNLRLTAEVSKVPYDTCTEWKKSNWWSQVVDEIKKTKSTEMNNKLSKIIDKSLSAIEDRLENGDFVFSQKTGEVLRKPVTIKDANTVAKDLLSHQIRVEEIANKIEERKETIQETLKVLADEFAKWNRRALNKTAETTDFKELTNALHDQRETGLQEGSREVHEQARR
jgi:hypothetical protein